MPTARQMLCANMFREYSPYSDSGIGGIVGNFSAESGINLPSAFRTTGLDHGSQGLAQWRDSRTHKRLTNYQNFVKRLHPGASNADLWAYYGRMEYQVKFTVHEMEHDFPGIHKRLKGNEDVIEFVDLICWQYERPNKQLAHLDIRRRHGKAVYDALKLQDRPAPVAPSATKVAQDAERRAGTAIVAGAGAGIASWIGDVSWPILATLGILVVIIVIHAALQHSQALKSIERPKVDKVDKDDEIDEIVDRVLERLDEKAKELLVTEEKFNG